MKIDTRTALEIGFHEAVIREAYRDSVGVWTWSVGLTNASGHNVERYIDNPQPMEKCLEVYLWALEKYADEVRAALKGTALTRAQFTAALSFHWNTGAIRKASWVKRFKAGDVAGARRAFMGYSKPASIIPRRRAERDLFFDGVWSGDGRITEYRVRKPGYQPDWGSARKVDISATLDRVLLSRSMPPDDPGVAPAAPEMPRRPRDIVSGLVILAGLIGGVIAAFYFFNR